MRGSKLNDGIHPLTTTPVGLPHLDHGLGPSLTVGIHARETQFLAARTLAATRNKNSSWKGKKLHTDITADYAR